MQKNILVTSIGSFSTNCTIKSLREINNGKIIGCDIYPKEWHAVSSEFDEVLLSPKVAHRQEYFTFINEAVDRFSIDLIIPLTDVDVDFFREERQFFIGRNVIVTIGDDYFLSVARDKYLLNVFLTNHPQFKRINTFERRELHTGMKFPLIAKPKNGRSSEGIYYLHTLNDIDKNVDAHHYIFQEVIEGPVFDVDYVRSRTTGNDFALPRKELLRTRNGAGMTVQTIENRQLQELACYIGKELDIVGCINFEFILNNNEYYLMDINPRFSAGIGFSKLAGYDFVKSHIHCFLDQDIVPPTTYRYLNMEKRMYEVINCVM